MNFQSLAPQHHQVLLPCRLKTGTLLVVSRAKVMCWHRPVTARLSRCRLTRQRSITIKQLLGSLTVTLRRR